MKTRNSRLPHRLVLQAGALSVTALFASTAGAQILADCHEDYASVQGWNNWYYGFFDGNSDTPWAMDDFEQLPIFNGAFWTRPEGPGGYWTRVTRDGGHPNGMVTSGNRVPEINWAVRRWVSPGDYVLDVSGRVWDAAPLPAGNGVIGRIQVNGDQVWSGTVENGNEHGLEFGLRLCVTRGTIIDFAIDPRDGNDVGDDTGCHALIRTIIDHQPQDTFTCDGGTTFVEVITIPGEYEYQWRFNGDPIEHDANFPVYRIVNLNHKMVGFYDCVVTDMCGSMVSDAAHVTICEADFDCDGFLDSRDFFSFLDSFFSGDPRADFNQDGNLNSQDFFNFLGVFFNGC